MESRKAKISEFQNLIEGSSKCVDKLLAELNWNRSKLRMPLNDTQNNNRSDTEAFPDSFLDANHVSSVRIDKQMVSAIIKNDTNSANLAVPVGSFEGRKVPNSHDDLLINFSKDERLALYRHVIVNTPKIDPPVDIKISFRKFDKDAKMTSLTEIATYRRDIRRRNQKYRISKNPLTYREEIKNLIQLQTEAIAEYLGKRRKDCEDIRSHVRLQYPDNRSRRRSRSQMRNSGAYPEERRTKHSESDRRTSKRTRRN